MVTTAHLLSRPGVREHVASVATDGHERAVSAVVVVEGADAIAAVPAGAVVVLTAAASAHLPPHGLDVAVRRAGEAGAAALGLVRGTAARDFPATVRLIAERAGLTLFAITDAAQATATTLRLADEVSAGHSAALERAAATSADLEAAETSGALEALLAAPEPEDGERAVLAHLAGIVTAGLGVPVVVRRPPSPGAPVVVAGRCEAVLVQRPAPGARDGAGPSGGPDDVLVDLVLHRAARTAEHVVTAARRSREAPIATRAALLAEMLSATEEGSGLLVGQARRAGIMVDGWHTVVHLDLHEHAAGTAEEQVSRHDLLAAAARRGLAAAAEDGGTWHRAESGGSLTYVRMAGTEPATSGVREVVSSAERIIDRLATVLPRVGFHCGVGGPHRGVQGLRTAWEEARAGSAAARAARRVDRPVVFAGLGFHRSLLQWYSGGGTHQMVDRLFAPLDAMDPRRRDEALRTLRVHLEHPGASATAAAVLNVHRNTLANRVRRLYELLDLDENDPDHRLMLSMATRLRTL